MANQDLSVSAIEDNGQGQPGNISMPAMTCDDLYLGLLECHDSIAFLSNAVLNDYNTDKDNGIYSILCLLKYRLNELSDKVYPYYSI